MKITPRRIVVVTIAITAFFVSGGFDASLLFLLTGALPGTSFAVPSLVMLVGFAVLFAAVLGLAIARPLAWLMQYLKEQAPVFRARLPRKRFQA